MLIGKVEANRKLPKKQHKEWHNSVNVYVSKNRPGRLELGMWKEAVEGKTEKQVPS